MKIINFSKINIKLFFLAILSISILPAMVSATDNVEIDSLVDKNYEMKKKTVNKIMNETGAEVLNITDLTHQDGKSTMKVKIIKDGKVQIIEQVQ